MWSPRSHTHHAFVPFTPAHVRIGPRSGESVFARLLACRVISFAYIYVPASCVCVVAFYTRRSLTSPPGPQATSSRAHTPLDIARRRGACVDRVVQRNTRAELVEPCAACFSPVPRPQHAPPTKLAASRRSLPAVHPQPPLPSSPKMEGGSPRTPSSHAHRAHSMVLLPPPWCYCPGLTIECPSHRADGVPMRRPLS